MEKKKRRSSQVFHFEQTDEALEENESLRDLYQNKNFVQPDPKELETIVEEGEEHRARRGGALVAKDGGLVIGKGKGRRTIDCYKYWKQDDKERNKRRKCMLVKHWKGRKKPKMVMLDRDAEQKLQEIIDTREESEDEDGEARREEDCRSQLRGGDLERDKSRILCVWGREGSGSSVEEDEGCLWSSRPELLCGEDLTGSGPPPPPGKSKRGMINSVSGQTTKMTGKNTVHKKGGVGDKLKPKPSGGRKGRPTKKKGEEDKTEEGSCMGNVPVIVISEEVTTIVPEVGGMQEVMTRVDSLDSERVVTSRVEGVCGATEMSLATLCSMIPAGELAELLDTDDLLFCGSKEVVKEVSNSGKGRESVRRSARLQNTPLITGLVFTQEEEHMEVINENMKKTNVNSHQEDMVDMGIEKNMKSDSVTKPHDTEKPIVQNPFNAMLSTNDIVMEEEIPNEVFEGAEFDYKSTSFSARQVDLQPQCFKKLRIPEVSTAAAMTPPPLSEDSKENFFLDNCARIKVTKKGKTKRRVPEPAPTFVQDSNVLTDLSNLLMGAKSGVTVPKGADMKAKTVNTISQSMANVGVTSRRKKKAVAPCPDTVGHCEEIESGTLSRRVSVEGSKNGSLEGSRRNSDISMPAAVRRSMTGEFVPRLNLPTTEPTLEVARDVKPVVSVGDAFMSDSEEEEIISGIFGKKTLGPRAKKQEMKINRGFLD